MLCMVSNATKLTIAYVSGIGVYSAVVFATELAGHPLMSVADSINILLALTVSVFAIVQGMSAYIQYEMQKNTNLIEDVRNMLEKAYGPIYSLLNKTIEKDQNYITLNAIEKQRLDEILSTYPFMFPAEINEHWQNNIRSLKSEKAVEVDSKLLLTGCDPIAASTFYDVYHIPLEFVNILNSEYQKKVQGFNALFIKKSAKSTD